MNHHDIVSADSSTLVAAYRSGETTPVAVAEVMVEAAHIVGELFNATAEVSADAALTSAEASRRRYEGGMPLGPLDGVPVSIKDSFRAEGMRWWHGSAGHAGAAPAKDDSAPVARLKEAGAVVFAKTVMAEFGLMNAGLSSQFGVVRNPWNPARTTGGSSSGAGVFLASGVGPISLGTDVGGSVRLPAALAGAAAMKTTFGRVAYDPPKQWAVAGPMARTIRDITIMTSVVGTTDPRDHYSLPGRFESREESWDLSGTRVGVVTDMGYGPDVDPQILAVVHTQAQYLREAGAIVTEGVSPSLDEAGYRAHTRYLYTKGYVELLSIPEERRHRVHPTLRRFIEANADSTAVQLLHDEQSIQKTRTTFANFVNGFDVILSPVLPVVSFPAEDFGTSEDDEPCWDIAFTAWFNVSGQPAGTICGGLSEDRMPIGIQIGGRRFEDDRVLTVLRYLESRREFDVPYPYLEDPNR